MAGNLETESKTAPCRHAVCQHSVSSPSPGVPCPSAFPASPWLVAHVARVACALPTGSAMRCRRPPLHPFDPARPVVDCLQMPRTQLMAASTSGTTWSTCWTPRMAPPKFGSWFRVRVWLIPSTVSTAQCRSPVGPYVTSHATAHGGITHAPFALGNMTVCMTIPQLQLVL